MPWGPNEAHVAFVTIFLDLLRYFPYLPCLGASGWSRIGATERFTVTEGVVAAVPGQMGSGLNLGSEQNPS